LRSPTARVKASGRRAPGKSVRVRVRVRVRVSAKWVGLPLPLPLPLPLTSHLGGGMLRIVNNTAACVTDPLDE